MVDFLLVGLFTVVDIASSRGDASLPGCSQSRIDVLSCARHLRGVFFMVNVMGGGFILLWAVVGLRI